MSQVPALHVLLIAEAVEEIETLHAGHHAHPAGGEVHDANHTHRRDGIHR